MFADELTFDQDIRSPHHGSRAVFDHAIMLAAFRLEIKFPGHAPDEQMKMRRDFAFVRTALAGLELEFPNGAGFAEAAFEPLGEQLQVIFPDFAGGRKLIRVGQIQP